MNLEALKPVNQCIYCGSKDDLTNEHIIPYALQGNWVLPKSSCKKCAAMTSDFERKILRHPLMPVRVATNMPTRHPKKRQSSFGIKVVKEGKTEERMVSIDDHLALLFLPLLPPAAYIDDRNYTSGIDIIGTETIIFGDDPITLMKKLEVESISVTSTYQYTAFLRMIGKIAYALSVAEFGLSVFAEPPFILPAIKGEVDNLGMWIGSDDYEFKVEKQGALHAVACGVSEWRGEKLIVAKVKLFANTRPSPMGYEVIIGRAK